MVSRLVFILVLGTTLLISAGLGIVFYASENPWVDFSILEHYNPGKPSILLDDQGNEWGRYELDKRQVRKLSQIPPCVINAFIAAEDWQFFSMVDSPIKASFALPSSILSPFEKLRVQVP